MAGFIRQDMTDWEDEDVQPYLEKLTAKYAHK